MDPELDAEWRRRFMEVYDRVAQSSLFEAPVQRDLDLNPETASKRFLRLLNLVRKGSSVKAAAKAVGMSPRCAQERVDSWYEAMPQGAQGERWRRRFDP